MMKKLFFFFVITAFAVTVNAQQNNTFLWRINNPGNKQASYLFGTIHLPQEKFMSLTDSVYYGINKSSVFYGELDYTNVYNDLYGENDGFFQSKLDYLDSAKKTASWKRMIAAINRTYKANIDPDSLEQFTSFGQHLLSDFMKPDPGVTAMDITLSAYAQALGKKTRGLETFRFQIDMLYKIIDTRLTDTTLLFNDDIKLSENMGRFYTAGQFDSLSAMIATIHPSYRKIVFDNRNFTMADSIEKITAGKTAFFAIGAGHLLGNNGLVNLLKAKGLQLTPVFSTNKISISLMDKLLGAALKNQKEELKKEKPAAKNKVIPEEQKEEFKEELKEEIEIGAPPPPKKKTPVKKPVTKKKAS